MNTVLKFRQTEEQKVYWISDTHFNHDPKWSIPLWKARGFNSAKEMTDAIIDSINKVIRPSDILIHCGDFCLNTTESQFEELLSRINCQNIYYIFGNHNSRIESAYRRTVKETFGRDDIEVYPIKYRNIIFIGNYAEITVDGQYFVVAHYPFYIWNFMKDGAKMICGHSHYNLPFSQAENLAAKILDVGFDGYKRPLSTNEVLEYMKNKKVFEAGDHHTNNGTK